MVSLRQLEYFVAVVEEGSFTRAAERLFVTQPALSHQVRALESSVGGPLLERLPRSVRLTPMGRAMLPGACAAVADARRAVTAARQAADLQCGEVQLATVASLSLGALTPALRVWRDAHPHVLLRLYEHGHADALEEAMSAGAADVAVGPVPRSWDGHITPLEDEHFVLLLAHGDPAVVRSQHGRLQLEELADREWVHYDASNGLSAVVDTACANSGFTPRAAVRSQQAAALPHFAAAGLGPALVPANIVPETFDGVVLAPAVPVVRALAAYAREPLDAVTEEVLQTLRRHIRVAPDHLAALRSFKAPARPSRASGRRTQDRARLAEKVRGGP